MSRRKHPQGFKLMKDGKSRVYTRPAEHREVRGTVKPLTQKELDFIRLFEGNALQAAKDAGYKAPGQAARRLMKKPAIIKAIRGREMDALAPKVASRIKRQEFWTDVMNDPNAKTADRLAASRLLGQSEGDFIERHEVVSDTIENRLRRLRELQGGHDVKAIDHKPCEEITCTSMDAVEEEMDGTSEGSDDDFSG